MHRQHGDPTNLLLFSQNMESELAIYYAIIIYCIVQAIYCYTSETTRLRNFIFCYKGAVHFYGNSLNNQLTNLDLL